MQKSKSILIKIFTILFILCCSIVLAFNITACSGSNGNDGADGVGIQSAVINQNGELVLTYTDGRTNNLGVIKGADGKDGTNGKDGENGTDGKDGTDGSSGIDGADGADGKGIKSVEIVNGKLVITYTDGKSETLDMPAAAGSACEHEYEEFVMSESTCRTKGVNIKVCAKGCGSSILSYAELNPDNHVYDVTVIKPTCTEEGYSTKICTECKHTEGKTDVVAALGHDETKVTTKATCEEDGYITTTCSRCDLKEVETATAENGLLKTGHSGIENALHLEVVEEGENRCVNGYQQLVVCKNCLEHVYESTTVAPSGHTVGENWRIDRNPTYTERGKISGFCSACETIAEVELPSFSEGIGVGNGRILAAGNYVENVVKPATCTEQGLTEYTITVGEWTHTFTYVTTSMHKYNGVDMDINKTYTADQVENVFGNALADCQKTGTGSFTCDECHTEFLVTVAGDHSKGETPIETVTSTCTKAGYKKYVCTVDGCGEEFIEKLELAPHTYGEPVAKQNDDGTVTLTFTCGVCGEKKVIEAKSVTDETTAATCQEAGKTVYTYTYDDENGEEQEGSFEVVIAKLKHENGKHVFGYEEDFEQNKGHVFEVQYIDRTFGNSPANCSTVGTGAFTCIHCNVEFLVDITGNHNFVKKDTIQPTCTEKGYDIYECDVCHNATENRNEVEALGHDYDVVVTANDENQTVTLTFTCKVCGDVDVKENVELDTSKGENGVETVVATCTTDGSVTYWYILDGESKSIVVSRTPAHTNQHKNANGDLLYTDGSVTYTVNDIDKTFGNAPASCTQKGSGSFTCTECGVDQLVPVTGNHAYGEEQHKLATCTEGGETYRECSICGDHKTISTSPANGHKYESNLEDSVEKQATFEEEGLYVEVCSVCGHRHEHILPKLNNDDYTLVEVSEGNCSVDEVVRYDYEFTLADGITKRVYSVRIVISATGEHKSDATYEWVYNGYKYTGYHCSECGKILVTGKVAVAD